MIPPPGIAVFAAPAAVSQQQSLLRAVLNGDKIDVTLPVSAFRSEQFSKYLASGLTTAIIVSAEDENGRGNRAAVRIEIRYDLWDEIYRVMKRDIAGTTEQLTLPTTARLNEWLTTTPFHVIDGRDGRIPVMLRVGVDVIPFSATEQAEAQRWLLHSMRDAETRQLGGAVATAPDETAGAFDRMIAGSVQPKAVLSFHWKVPVTRP